MGKFDKAIEESEDASDKDKAAAQDGGNMMRDSSSMAIDAVSETGDSGGGGNRRGSNNNLDNNAADGGIGSMNINAELANIKKDAEAAGKFVEQGGVSGTKRDNYERTIKYNDWVSSRFFYDECENQVKEKSIYYTTLVNGKATDNQIMNAYRLKESIKENCDKAGNSLLTSAINYIEIDHRVKENQKAKIVNIDGVEGFQFRSDTDTATATATDTARAADTATARATVTAEDKEGFEWYRDEPRASGVRNANMNPRLPLYSEQKINTGDGTGVLSWKNFYTDCKIQGANSSISCESAMNNKNTYIKAINNLFFEADTLINVLNQLVNPTAGSGSSYSSGSDNVNRNKVLQRVVEQQSSEIDVFKQKAHYSYEEYNTLTSVEDAIIFIYYALVVIYVLLFCRDWIMTRPPFDIRQYLIILMMVLYPRYILKVVLWVLLGLTKFVQLLGIKNVEFWS